MYNIYDKTKALVFSGDYDEAFEYIKDDIGFEEFNEYLDSTNTVIIDGASFSPSSVFYSMDKVNYLQHQEAYSEVIAETTLEDAKNNKLGRYTDYIVQYQDR